MPADCSAGEGSRKNYGHTYVQAGPALQRPNEKPQRSAIDAVLALIHQVEKAKAKNLIASALFMDVKGAFDNNVSAIRLQIDHEKTGIP